MQAENVRNHTNTGSGDVPAIYGARDSWYCAPVTPDARTRVRQRIKRLLEDRGKTNRQFGHAIGHKDSWVSHFLAGRFALSLDELDKVAAFFNVPPGDIVRTSAEPWELTPTEMRVVRALRMLPPSVRDHFATLIDYTIGTVPDEIEFLMHLRSLNPDERVHAEHLMRALASSPTGGRRITAPDGGPLVSEEQVELVRKKNRRGSRG